MSVSVGSVFETLRPCLVCGTEFYPPRNEKRIIQDHCSEECRRKIARRSLHAIAESARVERPPRDNTVIAVPATRKPTRTRVPRGPRAQPERRLRPEAVTPLGRRITTLRMRHGWRQIDLATKVGVHENSIAGWELGRGEPTLSMFVALAKALGVSLDGLWFGE